MSAKILILEDDRLFNETLQDLLEEEGYDVDTAYDPYTAYELSYAHTYDLYLFDINLPYEDGLTLLKRLREAEDTTPAIFLTSREDKASLLAGFDIGADDYLRKPIDTEELTARIGALLRRHVRKETMTIGAYRFDPVSHRLEKEGESIALTPKVSKLLSLFLSEKGRTITFDEIKQRLWAVSEEASDGALRVYVAQLKRYFGEYIRNVRGIGYCWTENHG